MGKFSDLAKKAAAGTAKGIGKLLWAVTKKSSKPLWSLIKTLHPIVNAAFLALGCVTVLFNPPLGAAILCMTAASYLVPVIGKQIGTIAAKTFPKLMDTINTIRAGKGPHAPTVLPPRYRGDPAEQGPNKSFDQSAKGSFNNSSASNRLWRKNFEAQQDRLSEERRELDQMEKQRQSQLREEEERRNALQAQQHLQSSNPFNSFSP